MVPSLPDNTSLFVLPPFILVALSAAQINTEFVCNSCNGPMHCESKASGSAACYPLDVG
jgi:hypothetical protein